MPGALPKTGAFISLVALLGALAALFVGAGTVAIACLAVLFFAVAAAVDEEPPPRRRRSTWQAPATSRGSGPDATAGEAGAAEVARALKSMMKKK